MWCRQGLSSWGYQQAGVQDPRNNPLTLEPALLDSQSNAEILQYKQASIGTEISTIRQFPNTSDAQKINDASHLQHKLWASGVKGQSSYS